MLNMIKMDLYRMFRTKSMYVVWIVLAVSVLFTTFMCKTDYDSLSKEDIGKIVELELNDLYERVKENGYTVELNKQAKDFLVEKGYDSKFGARPLKRVIQNQVEDLIAEAYIDGKIKEGDHLVITYKAKDEKLSIK